MHISIPRPIFPQPLVDTLDIVRGSQDRAVTNAAGSLQRMQAGGDSVVKSAVPTNHTTLQTPLPRNTP